MGNLNGLCLLASCYHLRFSANKDEKKVLCYYQKLAEMRYFTGAYNVEHYYKKEIGIEKDKCKVFTYYKKAVELDEYDRSH